MCRIRNCIRKLNILVGEAKVKGRGIVLSEHLCGMNKKEIKKLLILSIISLWFDKFLVVYFNACWCIFYFYFKLIICCNFLF